MLFVTGIGGGGIKSVAAGIFIRKDFVEVMRPRKGRPHMYIAGKPYARPATLIPL
jgi:hypothetical protein